jgi:hypothetical protein
MRGGFLEGNREFACLRKTKFNACGGVHNTCARICGERLPKLMQVCALALSRLCNSEFIESWSGILTATRHYPEQPCDCRLRGVGSCVFSQDSQVPCWVCYAKRVCGCFFLLLAFDTLSSWPICCHLLSVCTSSYILLRPLRLITSQWCLIAGLNWESGFKSWME